MVLEGGVAVGLAGMAGIAGFAEQRQVGQPVLRRQRPQTRETRRCPAIVDGNKRRRDKRQRRQQTKNDKGRTQQGKSPETGSDHTTTRSARAATAQKRLAARINAPRSAMVTLDPSPTRCATAGRMISEASAKPAPSNKEVISGCFWTGAFCMIFIPR